MQARERDAAEPVTHEDRRMQEREVAPGVAEDERQPWPGFSQREWDRLLFARWLVRTGRLSDWT